MRSGRDGKQLRMATGYVDQKGTKSRNNGKVRAFYSDFFIQSEIADKAAPVGDAKHRRHQHRRGCIGQGNPCSGNLRWKSNPDLPERHSRQRNQRGRQCRRSLHQAAPSPGSDLGIGNQSIYSPPRDRTFNGLIDEVALFDKALTDQQILAHYQSQFKETGGFQYAVKFVRGKSAGPVVAPGTYFTAINLHNPTMAKSVFAQ